MTHRGKAIIFSAPSGAGKTTIVKYLIEKNNHLAFSISATTRPKRVGETEGKDYYFLDPEVFRQKIDKDEFIEYEQVYKDRYYGTLKSEITRIWENGKTPDSRRRRKRRVGTEKVFQRRCTCYFHKTPEHRCT